MCVPACINECCSHTHCVHCALHGMFMCGDRPAWGALVLAFGGAQREHACVYIRPSMCFCVWTACAPCFLVPWAVLRPAWGALVPAFGGAQRECACVCPISMCPCVWTACAPCWSVLWAVLRPAWGALVLAFGGAQREHACVCVFLPACVYACGQHVPPCSLVPWAVLRPAWGALAPPSGGTSASMHATGRGRGVPEAGKAVPCARASPQ